MTFWHSFSLISFDYVTQRESIMLDNDDNEVPGKFPKCGAIIMSDSARKKESLKRKLFGLPSSSVSFMKQVKSGMILFLFEFERRELYGVYMACSDGAMDIVPRAFNSSGKRFPAQVRFNEIWRCSPLPEREFRDAIRENYWSAKKFKFGLSEDQVHRLLSLFSLRKLIHQSPRKGLSHSRIERLIRHSMDNAGSAIPCHKYSSSDGLMEKHGVGNVPLISGEFMGASLYGGAQSYSDGKFMQQALMENDFEEENDPVPIVWNDNLKEMSGRAGRFTGDGIFSAGDTMGYSPNVHRDLGPPTGGEDAQHHLCNEGSDIYRSMSRNMLRDSHNPWSDVGAANSYHYTGISMPGVNPSVYPDKSTPEADNIYRSMSRNMLRDSHNPWSDVGAANCYHYTGISRSGVNPSIYPDKSTPEADNMVYDQLKPTCYHSVEPRVSDINHAIPQAALISPSFLPCDANAWTGAGPANSYDCPRLSRSGVNPFVHPDNTVSDQRKPARYHSLEQQVSDINHAVSQAALISISPLPCDADAPRMSYNSKATADFNYSSDIVLECAPRFDTGFANKRTLPRQHSYEHSRTLSWMPKLLDEYTNKGNEILFDDEIFNPQSHLKFSSSAVMQSEGRFYGRENEDQAFSSVKSDNSMYFEYPLHSQSGFDYILSRDVENESLYCDNSMPVEGEGCPQIFGRAEIDKNPYDNKNSSPLLVDGSNPNSERIYSGNHKMRSTVFSRLTFSPDEDIQESFKCHFDNGIDMDTCAGETIAIFPHSRKQLVKTNVTTQYTDEDLHINRKRKSLYPMLKSGTQKIVSKKIKMYSGHVEDKNSEHNVEGRTSMDSKQVPENSKMDALSADVENCDQSIDAAPFIDFKRRKLSKVQDITKTRDCERSEVLLSGHQKKRKLVRPKFVNEASNYRGIERETSNNILLSLRESPVENDTSGKDCKRSKVLLSGQLKKRKLVRPKFDNEASDDRGFDGETSSKIMLSLQEGSVENDTSGRACETSRVLLTGQHGRRKLKRPTFGKNEISNGRGINAGTSNVLLLSSPKGSLENETSASFQCFLGTQVNENIDRTQGCGDKNLDDGEPMSSTAVTNSTVEDPLADWPVVPNDLLSNRGEGLIISKIDGFQDVPSLFSIKDEKWEVNESQDIVCKITRHNVWQDSTQENHIESSADGTTHIKSDNKKGSNDVSIEHVENRDEESGKTGNNPMTNSSCHLISESDGKILRACIDGEDEELLQLSLNAGSIEKRTSNQILRSLRPSEKHIPSDECEGFLQLSLGGQCMTSYDAANCSSIQERNLNVVIDETER